MSWVDRSTSQSSASLQQGRETSLRSLTRKFPSLVRFKNGAKIQTASSSGFDHFHQPTEEKESTPSNSSGRPLASLPRVCVRVGVCWCVRVCAGACWWVLEWVWERVIASEREKEREDHWKEVFCAPKRLRSIESERKSPSAPFFFFLRVLNIDWERRRGREWGWERTMAERACEAWAWAATAALRLFLQNSAHGQTLSVSFLTTDYLSPSSSHFPPHSPPPFFPRPFQPSLSLSLPL